MSEPLATDAPLSVRYGPDDPPEVGDSVIVYWGEARGKIGRIGSITSGISAYVTFADPTIPSADYARDRRFNGMFTIDSLRRIVHRIPAFDSRHELQEWLDRAGEQDYLRGDMVRVSVERWHDKEIRYGRIVNYLGITGNDPPQYSIAFEDRYGGDEEVKIISYYFIHGLV